MPLTSGTIPSMIGGVSQQDASVRLPNQIEEALNCNLSPARGAGPRSPAQFVGVLGSDIPDTAFFHSIVRDASEKYIVVIYPGRVRVFDHVTGKEYQVNVDAASMSYLNTVGESWRSLRAVTIDDYTFIANRASWCACPIRRPPVSSWAPSRRSRISRRPRCPPL